MLWLLGAVDWIEMFWLGPSNALRVGFQKTPFLSVVACRDMTDTLCHRSERDTGVPRL